jgi:uncharacterized protein (UPF0335 family)
MVRPRGSKNKGTVDYGEDGEDAPLRNTVSGGVLSEYIERIEYCNEQQRELSVDRQQIDKELKQAGYHRDTVREIVRKRKLTAEQRETAAALMDQYMSALGEFGNTPLGQAGADRVRAEAETG